MRGRERGTCTVTGCDVPHVAKGYCDRHYRRWRRGQEVTAEPLTRADRLQWLADLAVDPPDDCVEWPWSRRRNGYGLLSVGRYFIAASHLALEASGRPKPGAPRDNALHSCDNPPCVNPRHLRWGTSADNAQERRDRGRQSSRKGTANGRAIIDQAKADEIRAVRASEGLTYREIGLRYGVSASAVAFVVKGLRWNDNAA